ncbi:polycomb group protein ASXL1 isoform X2 [Sphaeramia orbicularis]|uniref:polycomb group protein ASXL1 isoform X2 n=1 Tax=Sphaeramia orbicularis TaxID=375764 RepID=UPI00117D4CD4|nr:putative Polycomb group protein ASXL1 isoform X2 [Sphaeramia orbicularis]
MKDKQKRKKERTWAEAARMVLENFSDAPMTPKQILHVIQTKGLKEMRSGTAPLACLVTMLHSQVRGDRVKNSIFFKLPGRMSLFTLKKNALQWTKTTAESELPTVPASSTPPPVSSSSPPTTSSTVAPAGPSEATEQESCDSTETAAAASGDNDASVDESSSSASCSTETPAPISQPQTRLSRAAGQQGRSDSQGQQAQHTQHAQTRLSRSRQSGRQRKKAVMMPRVVLTPLKVNGEHVPSGPMKRSRGGVDVDFETPGSILVNTNIRALINVRTFSAFPAHSQQQLLQLLPEVDRQIGPDGMARLSSSALNNEFFTHASQSWKERLAEGEFTHEMQVRFRQEMEKEKKVEAWKEKFFEEYHGQKSGLTREESLKLTMSEASEVAASVLESDVAVVATGAPKRRSVGRRRRDGRMRRRTRADLRRRARRTLCKAPAPAQQATEPPEVGTVLETSAVSIGSPMSDNAVVQGEVVLQAECGVELPAESASMEPKPAPTPEPVMLPEPTPTPTPTPSPSPSPASTSANEEPEVSARLLPEEAAPALASTSSPSSSSSSSSSASSPASSPSSPSDRQTFAAGLDSSSSSSASSSAAVAADPLDDTASVVTSITGGTATSSRESSPSASPATTPVSSTQLKDQKRRPDETQAFCSFPEKRPRLDDRQSFRTTIDSVRSEKPQPTTEEPKVPPIRIQLSRIKPPWVKGHPTYQICPRIVPPGQGSRRSGTGGARTLADIKARAQQARAQREAAAAVAASSDGAAPAGIGLRPGTGLHDSNNGRRAREHPGPVEPGGGRRGSGGMEEQGSSAGSDSSGTQLLLLNVEPTPQPSPSPSSTSVSLSLEPSQTPSPRQEDAIGGTLGGEEEEETAAAVSIQSSSSETGDKAVESGSLESDTGSRSEENQPFRQSQTLESASVPSEKADKSCESPPLAPTSIPDSLPRFGAQGVDVIQKLASCQTKEQEQGKETGLGGVIQHGSHHINTQDTPLHRSTERQTGTASPHHVDSSSGEKDDEVGVHSDSTETASDCENESQEEEQQQDRDWCSQMSSQRNSQLVICNPAPQNQQPVIQAHVSSRYGQTVIQHCFPNGLSHSQQHRDHQSVPAAQPQGLKETNIMVKMEQGDDCKASRQSSAEEDCRGSLKPSITPPNSAAGSKRSVSSARPVSSVEANNPLVTQLLQGSLPLEKVLPSHPVNRLEINRLPGSQLRPPVARTPGPRSRSETSPQSPGTEPTPVAQCYNKSPTGRTVSCLMETPSMSQYQSQQAAGAVPVITSLPPSSSSSTSKCKPDLSCQPSVDSVKESPGHQPSRGSTPDRALPTHRTIANGPSPPLADPCPPEAVPTIKINWRPPQSLLPYSNPQQLSPVSSVKNESGARPSCQALAKSSPIVPLSVTKKELVNSMDGYLSGGAMEGLLNMEMTLARMAKKEHSKGAYSTGSPSSTSPSPSSSASALPFQLYGKLPKQTTAVGGVSYTANVSVMDNSSFSRSVADGVLQLRPRLTSSQTTLSIQAFTDSTAEEVALKCSCRLKAMIMCQGCGAFCHDDCIGPSKLCVSCLVVR